ncbi:MAG: (2Fe-2S)-binding protein [Elusimicrobiota bacterium]|nr:(2Fe-2S)-binding protein [Elusimicrobiota bacterium]
MVLTVNGKRRSFGGPAFTRLIDFLRETLRLTGTKEGCGEGECGACTVLIDGAPVNSCLVPVCSVAGAKVETVESLGAPEKLSRLQQGFLDCAGAQCGICTPGMLMSAHAHLKAKGAKADDASVREAISGNLCRCTGYQHIVDSVLCAARKTAKRKR